MAAPKGNNNAAKGAQWREAVLCALKAYEDDSVKRGAALKAVGKKLIAMALDGDIQAIKEIGDRLDGKAVQAVDNTITYTYDARDLTDSILAHIATGGGPGITDAPNSSKKLQ